MWLTASVNSTRGRFKVTDFLLDFHGDRADKPKPMDASSWKRLKVEAADMAVPPKRKSYGRKRGGSLESEQ